MTHRITSIEIRHYRIPLDPPFRAAWDPNPRTTFTNTVVRVCAGEYEGVGSGDAMLGFPGHEHLFIGQDPFAIERHVRLLDNLQFHYGRAWPLEVALWDLMGQIAGQPVWKLLGGRSQRVQLYASCGERQPAAERAESARALKALGYPALKIRFHDADLRRDIAVVAAAREAIGPVMHILVDANQGWQMPWDASPTWDFKTALWVAEALTELGVFWLEEPLHRHDYEGLAALRRRAKLRIAGGEGNREFSELRQYLRHGSFDVYQPDAVWATGLHRARQIAGEVQAAGCLFTPHTWGDGLVLLANLHVCAALSTAPFVEFPFDPPNWTPERRDFLLPQPLLPSGPGYIDLPDTPGLGVRLDWERLEARRIESGTMKSN